MLKLCPKEHGGTARSTGRMLTLPFAGPARKKPMAARKKKKATKFKWCVFKLTKSGRRKVSCHKYKRTAQAAAKKKGGKGNRVIKLK